MHKRVYTLIGAAAAAVLALAACSSGSSKPSSTSSSSGGSGGSGGATKPSLVVETAFSLTTLDPARMFEPTGFMIDHALYSTLLSFKGNDVKTPVPDLAESYTASADAKVFTFKLNPKAVFSDGAPVTSADVKYSLDRVANVKGNPSFLMAGITVTAPDPETVVLTSATPNPAIPYIVPTPALAIVNSKAVTADGGSDAVGADTADKAERKLNAASQGSGPYILDSFSTTSQVVISANPKYWGPKPTYSKIVIRNTQASVQKLDVLKDSAQVAVDLSPTQAAGLSNVQVVNGASPNVFFMYLNNTSSVSATSSNPDFQEAVRYGIDYDGLVQLAGTGAVQAAGIIPTTFVGSLAAGSGVKRDVARAKAALAKSGIKNPTITLIYPTDVQVNGISFGDLAARVQQNLSDVGITVKLAGSSTQTWLTQYRSGKSESGVAYWGPDYPNPSDYLNFLPGALVGLRAGWPAGSDPTLEALGKKAGSTVDTATSTSLYEQIQEMMNTKSPFIPLIQPAQILVAAKSVQNVQSNALWLVSLGELG